MEASSYVVLSDFDENNRLLNVSSLRPFRICSRCFVVPLNYPLVLLPSTTINYPVLQFYSTFLRPLVPRRHF